MISMSAEQVRSLPVLPPGEGKLLPVGSLFMQPTPRKNFDEAANRNRYTPFDFLYCDVCAPGKFVGLFGQCTPRDDRVLI